MKTCFEDFGASSNISDFMIFKFSSLFYRIVFFLNFDVSERLLFDFIFVLLVFREN